MSEALCRSCGDRQNGRFCDQCGAAMAGHWSTAELRNALARNDAGAWKALRDVLAASPTKELEAVGVPLPVFSAIQLQRITPDKIPTAALDLVTARHAEKRQHETEFAKAFTSTKPSVANRRFQPLEAPSARWYRQFAGNKKSTSWRVNR